jgi:hypothetical protein
MHRTHKCESTAIQGHPNFHVAASAVTYLNVLQMLFLRHRMAPCRRWFLSAEAIEDRRNGARKSAGSFSG